MAKRASDGRPKLPKISDEVDGDEAINTEIRAPAKIAKGRERPFLIVLAGNAIGEMYRLTHTEVVLGRARRATIHVDDDGVSRKHARLVREGTAVHIEDLGSANGTFVNDELLRSSRLLQAGDKITLGSTILKFTYNDEIEEAFQRRLHEAALRDGLTGAFNKRYLMDRLATEIAFARRHRTALAVIMLDVDHFKAINDTFGHPAGDAVLQSLTHIVLGTIRNEDVFARYGGEEFAVVCRSVDGANATVLAERLRARVASAPVEHGGERIRVEISLGVAAFPEVAAETSEDLLSAADEALYEAKGSGRNRVVTKRRA